MKKYKLLPFILFISIFGKDLYCQKIFREGYVVKITGESLTGMIEYAINQDIPSICLFKRFDIARPVVYSPDEIMAFGYINGNRYESKNLNNKNSFYEVLVTGKIILYQKGSKYYLGKANQEFFELKNGTSSYSIDGVMKEFSNLPEFLNFITEGIAGSIGDKFKLKDEIISLIVSYNKESGKNYYTFNRSMSEKQLIQKTLETGANKYRIGPSSGVNIYKLNLLPDDGNSNYLPDSETETGFMAGLSFERLLFRKTDRLSLKIDLLFIKQTFYCFEEADKGIAEYSRNDTFFNFTGIKAPVLIQYSVTGSRLVPYLNAGFAYQYIIDKNFLRIEEIENSYNEINTYEYRNIGFKKGEISSVAGLGLRSRIFNNMNLHIEGRFEFGSGLLYKIQSQTMLPEKDLKQNSIQTSFLIGITF